MTTALRILTWNLFHGRAQPPAGRDLQDEFAAALAGWAWDVALLQEVPPWWAAGLGRACAAHARSALTSRNELPALRRALAVRAPDLVKSGGGGANVILVRATCGPIAAQRRLLLRRWPERRVCHAVALASGLWCANLHASVHSPPRARADIARAAAAALAWSGGGPTVLGGDFNVRAPAAPGFEPVGAGGVDHVLAHGVAAGGPARVPERGGLSDHAPLLVTLLPPPAPRAG
jgi:endonuclease/exonuclease/phosphatase family metal-dependent hydrolase